MQTPRRRAARFVTALGALSLFTTTASAHFLFAHVIRGDQPRVELHLAESAWEPNDGMRMTGLIQRARAWYPGSDDSPVFATQPFGLVADLPADQDLLAADLEYGVMNRGAKFMLVYHAKGAATLAAAGRAAGLRTEITAAAAGDEVLLTVRRDGAPAAGAKLTVPLPGSSFTEEVTTDADGQVRILAPATPVWSVRGLVTDATPGVRDGEAYPETRHYTTLTVYEAAAHDSDGRAWALLRDAQRCTATLPASVRHVSGEVSIRSGGRVSRARYSVAGTDVQVTAADDGDGPALPPQLAEQVAEQLRALFPSRPLRRSDATRFGEYDGHPTGRPIRVGSDDRLRIRERQVVEHTWIEANLRRTLCVLGTRLTHADQFLPEHFTVTTADGDEQLLRVDQYSVTYREQPFGADGSVHVPKSCTVVTVTANAAPQTTTLRFGEATLATTAAR